MKNNDKNINKYAPNGRNNNFLSENYILSMSEEDYMNDVQLSFFKNKLKQLEQEILLKAEETTEYLRETQFVPDPADRATIEEEHTIELRTRDRERKLLKKIQKSISRIETGEYGWCEETGEPIGIPRLLARPTATLSLEAQERREMRQKLYGG
ncbi:DnaK suppressor protein [Candidatus Kinetoplastibacterium blastocrithidii TCC012E]|uniref:RNA polymerase-binding transcription factor DksA n=1 Tax=Candidatus Kinetoplastidibacterium blastocrithidiae TCC012E TaxID=1208922 RepID=M1M1F8_9PROT|nr:RNA polymerase-binding protein DksA [Candidatus Kinetoplastibacterium blastocrithidii]AFZ83290.1 DnaK suppressor protein [Candidatus Kinetoplastibacterium blastocrithidii (ex Strigomonas culicis)]AGF50106.1 DnaK suppressor protein [Candidatus Kinetoplastibacterium blastocrithidii TCC012E]